MVWAKYLKKKKKPNSKIFFSTPTGKTEYMVMMSIKLSTIIVKFMLPRSVIQALWFGHNGNIESRY